jgi:hypothetical protein
MFRPGQKSLVRSGERYGCQGKNEEEWKGQREIISESHFSHLALSFAASQKCLARIEKKMQQSVNKTTKAVYWEEDFWARTFFSGVAGGE